MKSCHMDLAHMGQLQLALLLKKMKLVGLAKNRLTQRLSHAVGERIAVVSRPTSASGNVILNPTVCVGATDA